MAEPNVPPVLPVAQNAVANEDEQAAQPNSARYFKYQIFGPLLPWPGSE